MEKLRALQGLFDSADLVFLMGAHDAVSAKIAQDAGFPGVWVSGLGLSAINGLRDSNELSWTQVMERIEMLSDRIAVPALVDMDTGYGDFNNVRLAVRRLQRIGAGGACIEDKLFPKANSFLAAGQVLAEPGEFCGRLKAAKDTAADVFLVARCEALVAGQSLSEAIDRCGLYAESGADAVLIHSKKTVPDEILAFMAEWDGRVPVAVVPTKYSDVEPAVLEQAGVSVAIWANQSLRAAIIAMQRLCGDLAERKTMRGLESGIADLSRVFELANNAELDRAKAQYSRYVPPGREPLAANGSLSRAAESVEDVIRLRRAWSAVQPLAEDAEANLLDHAGATVPFYQGVGAQKLSELPIVDRRAYEYGIADFTSRAPTGENHLNSSGTTGNPLTIAVDDASWYAVNYHFFTQISELAGLPPDGFAAGELAVLFVSNKPGRDTFVRPLPALNYGLYARLQLDLSAKAAHTFTRLPAQILYGKATYLLDLRAALLAQGITSPPWSPRLVLVSGEPLHTDDRARLTDYYGAPVVDALASTEGGLIAATRPGENDYQVFAANVRLEVLTDDGAVRDAGVGELVLTNLIYRDTVFLRYRTGDRAELETDAGGAQRLVRLWGREPRTLRFGTRRLDTRELTERFGSLPGMGDFQIVSRLDGALLRWMPDAGWPEPEALRRSLRAAVDELLADQEVEFELCSRITPPGGKKRRFR
ncbi:isocitrate lyase/phosphoenolpyruvate mutase family protein [Nocardia sp. NPDC006044]|uniref:isocitrate lyase/phosphoenolpyruvate mutase family protein n=1 Tax=Nocardia sp. NPDC006044 TaxID=3364306 RepID=UPI003693B402